MLGRIARTLPAAALALAVGLFQPAATSAGDAQELAVGHGIVKLKSAYPMQETVARLQADIKGKGIMIFNVIDQAKLAQDAGIKLRPSTLLVFGNPPLGTQFMTSNPLSGIDWPVRLLVVEDESANVWLVYSDFHYLARRHGIADRDAQFAMAANVVAFIASSVGAR